MLRTSCMTEDPSSQLPSTLVLKKYTLLCCSVSFIKIPIKKDDFSWENGKKRLYNFISLPLISHTISPYISEHLQITLLLCTNVFVPYDFAQTPSCIISYNRSLLSMLKLFVSYFIHVTHLKTSSDVFHSSFFSVPSPRKHSATLSIYK